MTIRSRRETITFRHPAHIRGIERALPAGAYEVVTDEEMIEGLSFASWRRIATMITVPSEGVRGATEMLSIGSVDLADAQAADAQASDVQAADVQASDVQASDVQALEARVAHD